MKTVLLRQRMQTQFEKLLSLDARTKELISAIEKIPTDVSDVKLFREQLDICQDEINGNITIMSSILNELQLTKMGLLPYKRALDLSRSVSYSMEQLSFLQDSYRKAIFKAFRQLEVIERDHLVKSGSSPKSVNGLNELNDEYETSLELTRDMTAHARRLAEEVKLGALNAELLEDSSTQIGLNYAELKDMGSQMGQSRRLTSLAYRRRLTSYVLYSLAFTFFFLSAATIFLNRLPMGSWLLPSSYL
ncbi:Protein transport protein SEC20 [Paragonimus skrjabini miyazakii]|uniref:Protein transport protein SEC20 n=1 Tax=Paragonimus skrjabini miyazakii TaxID=59628 RepID=A0A8S9YY91_9TREM|nr:Protein transport protein SEC20 [Paragonimus skrjabini miyazakii]